MWTGGSPATSGAPTTQNGHRPAAQHEQREREALDHERRAHQQQAEQAAREALAERQRQLKADNPDMDAVTLMMLASGETSSVNLQFDELYSAERRGYDAVMHRLDPQPTTEESS